MAIADDLTRYRRISTLGSGGMARVDLAEDTLLGRQVALKRMNETAGPSGVLRLRREAMTGASLSHPNLVSIYDVVTGEDGHLVVVMEYVAGETLRARLGREGRLPVGEALHILEGVAAGLDAIHARGIVHRDVKPSNILLGADGAVKLADLGIASVPDGTRITTSGSIIGSLSYMAPEQLADTRARPAIDIYALAAMAFELLSGHKARRETNAVALAHALATQPPPDLRAAWPDAPAAAVQTVSRGMARDPSARPRSAGELVAGLKAALEPEPTVPMRALAPVPAPVSAVPADAKSAAPRHARPAGPPAAVYRHRRSPAAAVAAALLGLVALAVVLAVVLNSGSGQPQRSASGSTSRHGSGGTTQGSGGTTQASGGTTHGSGGTATHTGTSASRPATSGNASAPPSSGTSSTPAPSGTSSTSTPSGASSAGASSAGGPSPSTTPISAVESFYQLAAAHRYDEAWALADPSLRAQLLGLRSFEAGLAGTRSITFGDARSVSQSSGGATVAIQTTSLRDDGTHSCTGTVDLVRGGSTAGWLLHQVHITCT
ncbi:MAG: serine/threonine protein kinase [Solirubrobacterales bacterium]|nr:serine/threonine protein kinase [Solirubrobacterales bacterium]